MSLQIQFDAFLSAMCKDSHLKNRIILWTFLALVFPTAFLVAAGVPEKPAYITMAVLVLPLQIAVYSLTSDRKPQSTRVAVPNVFLGRATTRRARRRPRLEDGARLEIEKLVLSHPDSDSSDWHDILKNLKVQDPSLILVVSHHGSLSSWN